MNIVHGKEEMLPRVAFAEALSDYSLVLTFKNGERKKYNAKPLLDIPMYKNLAKVFSSAKVEYGTVVWPGDIDISPDTLYLNSEKIS